MKVLHIITDLDNGGAEAILFHLIVNTTNVEHHVISLTPGGKYVALLQDKGIAVSSLNLSSKRLNMKALPSLISTIKSLSPDVVQTWLYHGDLMGTLATIYIKLTRNQRFKLVWSMHNSTLDPAQSRLRTRRIVQLLAYLSRRYPAKIICCSYSGYKEHVRQGYDESRMTVVTNGYDLDRFQDKTAANPEESPESHLLFGCVARWGAQKDHANLLAACALLRDEHSVKFKCMLVGPEMNNENPNLLELIERYQLQDLIELCGEQTDIPNILSNWHCSVLPSAFGEAFPNVVAESMACSTPAVVTDVGDAAYMVGDTGWVVPPKDPAKLAASIADVYSSIQNAQTWNDRKQSCRRRAIEHFGIEKMTAGYSNIWEKS